MKRYISPEHGIGVDAKDANDAAKKIEKELKDRKKNDKAKSEDKKAENSTSSPAK